MENKETQQIAKIKDMSLTLNKPYIAYVFKKTQKIAQALYLITEHFDPSESLRSSIRTNAGMLLNCATALLKTDQKDKRHSSHMLSASFLETMAFIETASLVRLISESNFSILKEEIINLLDTLDSNQEKAVTLGREFMETGTLEEYKRQAEADKGQSSVLYTKDIKTRPIEVPVSLVAARPKVLQLENKSRRLDTMLSFFKGGKELMIKDITSHLKDVSEKTIQRELLHLVATGKLAKIGKKRWSRYRLS